MRVQPKLWGGPVVTYPTGARKYQAQLPGLDADAERQLEADAVRMWLERLREAELPELDEPPDLEG